MTSFFFVAAAFIICSIRIACSLQKLLITLGNLLSSFPSFGVLGAAKLLCPVCLWWLCAEAGTNCLIDGFLMKVLQLELYWFKSRQLTIWNKAEQRCFLLTLKKQFWLKCTYCPTLCMVYLKFLSEMCLSFKWNTYKDLSLNDAKTHCLWGLSWFLLACALILIKEGLIVPSLTCATLFSD